MEQPENTLAAQEPDKVTLPSETPVQPAQDTETAPSQSDDHAAPCSGPCSEPSATLPEEQPGADDSTDDILPAPEQEATCESIIEKLKELDAKDPAEYSGEDIRRLKQHFAILRKSANARAIEEWALAGNNPDEFVPADAETDTLAADLIASLKEKKAAWTEELDRRKAQNLERKNLIIEEILALAADTDNVNRTFQRYRDLQEEFNSLGEVPATEETTIWKRFADAREKYSDNLKINKELRDYDFKKNLDLKQALIAEAKTLIEEKDVLVAYRRLQELHNKWRQIGPVAKEIREEIWENFKSLSAEINKRHQTYFEERKSREQANEQGKTAICERVEALDFSTLDSFSQWDAMTKQIIQAQEEWKQFGFASRKMNNALFARFRAVCDNFFTQKAAYYKKVRDELASNLTAKTALCEKAEALKDSTDWARTSDQIMNLQKEWKTIGSVPKRHSDAIWKRFQAACDHFFEQRKKAGSGQRKAEQENLRAKRDIIASLATINADMPKDEVVAMLRDLQDKWQTIGHVPFREKDKVYDDYRARLNDIREMFDLKESRARMERFNAAVAEIEGDEQKIYRERERLVRVADAKRLELRTLENNLGFLSSKSKSGDSMLREFSRKIDRLKADITEIEDKIKVLDSKI